MANSNSDYDQPRLEAHEILDPLLPSRCKPCIEGQRFIGGVCLRVARQALTNSEAKQEIKDFFANCPLGATVLKNPVEGGRTIRCELGNMHGVRYD